MICFSPAAEAGSNHAPVPWRENRHGCFFCHDNKLIPGTAGWGNQPHALSRGSSMSTQDKRRDDTDLQQAIQKTNKKNTVNTNASFARTAACIVLTAVLIVLDQITKKIAVRVLASGTAIPLIPGVLEFTYVQNRGAAFGILQNARPFFFVITAAALIVIGYILSRIPSGRKYIPAVLCLCAIAAGAVGNLIDRILLSYVRDFIYFSLIDFPVFNVADIYITCATIIMVLLCLFFYKEEDLAFLGKDS